MSETQQQLLKATTFLACFGTPAFVFWLPDAQRLNQALKKTILAREAAQTGLTNSNVGGWHSGRDFADWGGPALEELLNIAKGFANQITLDRQGRRAHPAWRVECWANVNRRGHANKRHSHPGCFLSGSYYVDVGEAGLTPHCGGRFRFHDPRAAASTLTPATAEAAENRPDIRPEAGMMLLFPSWMPHSVERYDGAGTRISIAFNLALAGDRR
ncbi:MAG TPA: 2OG-Fe(II) oxygenase family protein [Kiloniellaceae bacterium]|nr:2OG-Fe(II) oxygenase family protein [Kiloniellaceae bacterium]